MSSFVRLILAFSLLLAPLATYADTTPVYPVRTDSRQQEYPAMSVTIESQAGPVTITAAAIPKKNESEFLKEQLEDRSDRLAIVYSDEDGPVAKELDQAAPEHPELSLLKVSESELKSATQESRKIFPISLKSMKAASLVIITTNLGILAPPLYFSSSTAPAFAAAFAFIAAQVVANDRFQFVTDYITGASKAFEKGARQYFPNSPRAPKIGAHLGRMGAALSYSLFSNSVTRFLMNNFDIKASVGSVAGLTNIGVSALTSFFTSSIWDIFFARLRNSGQEEDMKVAQLMVWVKTLYLFTLAPLMLSSHTYIEGMTAMVAFGALGFYANYNEKPFIRAGRFVLKKMESSEKFSRIFTSLLRTQDNVFAKFRTMSNSLRRVFKCQSLLVKSVN